ncbi:glycoside hydrolase family 3 N-terminal domain-containing protein, partial [Deinococcus pimensis]|uniref:glycoside hydrolase family 3 N-terminal domain-containing protein n=1 Tax=Deinococcus pimensis TaxID=309888 RepID=UPI00248004A5
MTDLPGPVLDERWRAHLSRHGFAGVCLFRRNVVNDEQVRALVRDVREVLGSEAFVAIDQEGGAVLRVLDAPLSPAPMALGAVGDVALARRVGAATGRALLSLGINWNFAPVLDVNSDPLNPVIGERSFCGDAALVAELGAAWALGLEDAGVLSCAKHFPGHGDTREDSHL